MSTAYRDADLDALATLPPPEDVRRQLSRRLRECDVLRRLLRVAEYAHGELHRHPADRRERQEVQR